jgi:peptidoglycan/LPS O-acetylase OafA/YrhL
VTSPRPIGDTVAPFEQAIVAAKDIGFRRDVEGLRAVAIGLVLAYHTGIGVASGGFVGVDIFFVISGFLITGQLVGELRRCGSISLGRFYA